MDWNEKMRRTPQHHTSRENPACFNLALKLRVSVFKTNNLQKEKDCPRPVHMMEFYLVK